MVSIQVNYIRSYIRKELWLLSDYMQVFLSAGCVLGVVHEAIQVKTFPDKFVDYYTVFELDVLLINHAVCCYVTIYEK